MPRDPILDHFSGKEPEPPKDKAAWIKMALREDLTGPTISICDEEFNSASKFTIRQFLRLRTLWKPVEPEDFDPTKFGLSKEEIDEARIELASYNSWNSYCESFESGTKMKEGNFFAAKIHQKNAADVISEIISSPIANRTRSKNANKSRPDGYLTDKSGEACRGLIEVKAARRYKHLFEIFRQESAQMVAWIISEPDRDPRLPGRRFQVLQDQQEIFMNFVEYGDEFVEYVKGKEVDINDPNSLNTIFQIGPYNTKERGEMERLGPILLALTKRGARDAAEEEVKAKEEEKEKISRGQHYPDRTNLTKRLAEVRLTNK